MIRQIKISKQITNRNTISFERYLAEVSRTKPPLTAEEEVLLAQRAAAGDNSAIAELITRNLRFVISVAKQYGAAHNVSLEDLISEGNIGLIKAAKRFDETRGFKFISYAVWWIRQSMMSFLAENARHIRLPLNKISEINKVKKIHNRLEQLLEREPISYEIEDILLEEDENCTINVDEIIRLDNFITSIDAPIQDKKGDDIGTAISDLIQSDEKNPDYEVTVKESIAKNISTMLCELRERDRDMISLYYGLNGQETMTLDEIGKRFDLSRERVRQINERTIRILRSKSRRYSYIKEHLK